MLLILPICQRHLLSVVVLQGCFGYATKDCRLNQGLEPALASTESL